ncbi:MAG: cbb3-type cytochrome c oxidase subunit 3 [Melioribacteraceae bacterium]|nr:cbb3-type cytochrome c oxidase subunit 3 [Melioribacteraceae bacterium]MCF8263342.1 cbb3-type cytochrome c oxidase subunit 3 [Melioribacteraceae bacterium]MCF8414081.1 cbb3-type cytochrome c oxidase subunit 3 [Melioribacteraceae bacterium]
MFSNYLSSIDGVSGYAIFTLILFFSIMLFSILWVVKLDKSYVNKMSNLPLEDENEIDIEKQIKNEN